MRLFWRNVTKARRWSTTLSDDESALLAQWQQEAQIERHDETEQILRTWGFDPKQRRALLRSRHAGRDRARRGRDDGVPYQDTIVKQYAYYIKERVADWNGTGPSPAEAAATWAKLTKYKIDDAKRWWDAGVHPLALDQITELMLAGLEPADLAIRVQQRSIAEHLARGSSVAWCLHAARSSRPKSA